MMTTNLEFDLGSGKFFPKPVSKCEFTDRKILQTTINVILEGENSKIVAEAKLNLDKYDK